MPARAFGAPQTTRTGSPDPASTMQTRSRSALGCGSAEITRARERAPPNLFPLSCAFPPRAPVVGVLAPPPAGGPGGRTSPLRREGFYFPAPPPGGRPPPPPGGGGGGGGGACSIAAAIVSN